MKYFTRILIVSFLINSFSSKAQRIDSMMNIYAQEFPQQKVHVHFDKDIYRAGESIWFKAYIFAGFSPALNSKNFYAELIDNAGNIVQRKVYRVIESTTAGSFDIPENSVAANLRFRGYTTWMLNFDTSFLYSKNILITNNAGVAPTQVKQNRTVSLRFFPEGGELVNSLESVVAFKANDNTGMPVNIKGNIRNSKGEIVANIISQHDGMGTFTITPSLNETYTATYTDEEGVERSATLPNAKSTGAILNVSTAGNRAVFVVKRTTDVATNQQSVYIVAHLAQKLIYKAKVPLEKTMFTSGSFSIATLPSGIVQFTLFDNDWKPIAERIIMVYNDEYRIKTSVEALLVNNNKRAKNVLEIQVEDTLLGNLSVSVTDAEIKDNPYSDNIVSRLLLTGDLKGYVHNPSYYFQDESSRKNLDLVMLTNGWRRYNWDDVVKLRTPVIRFPDTTYLSLNARVFGLGGSNTLKADEALTAILQAKDSGIQVLSIPKTGADIFSLSNLIFFDTVRVHYQFNKNKRLERNLTLRLDNGLYQGYKKINTADLPVVNVLPSDSALKRTADLSDQILKYGSSWGGKGNVLETVTVRTRPRSALEELDKKYVSGMFSSSNAYSFDLINESIYYSDIFSFLQAKVPGLIIYRGMGDVSVSWRFNPTTVFIDERQSDPNLLTSISVTDIAYVKVFRPPFFGDTGGGAGGAIAVYTRRGGDMVEVPSKGLSSDKLAGYSTYKEFYSPDYSTRSGSADVIADYRSTLYWNPYILTDATKRKVQVEFFNNDITKAFRVVLEGINEVGKLVRIEKVIQ